jgi:hypothetical protein
MRRLILASALFVSACATRPQQPETVSPPPVTSQPQQQPRGLIGMTPSDLMHHFGTPAMQIREGTSLKLQFRGRLCVLDAYLYPSGSGAGALRVTHVDTRAPSGIDYSQAACVSALENPS